MITFSPAASSRFSNSVNIAAKSAIALRIDDRLRGSGRIIFEKNANYKVEPASLTKLMTCIVMLDQISSLELEFEILPCDITKGSGNNLQPGDILNYEQAIYEMLLPSSNTTAAAVARSIGEKMLLESDPMYLLKGDRNKDSVKKFMELMNEKARCLGMNDTRFSNPSGLRMTAMKTTCLDMAKMGLYALRYKRLTDVWGREKYLLSIRGRDENLKTSIKMLRKGSKYFCNIVLGGKTGTLKKWKEVNNLLVVAKNYYGGEYLMLTMESATDALRYIDMRTLINVFVQNDSQ